jgi:hypothetical protein
VDGVRAVVVSLLFVGRQLGDTKRQMKGADGRC